MQNQSVVVLTSTTNITASLRRIRQAIPELETLRETLCEQDPRFEQVGEILRCAIVAEDWISREVAAQHSSPSEQHNGEIGGDYPGQE